MFSLAADGWGARADGAARRAPSHHRARDDRHSSYYRHEEPADGRRYHSRAGRGYGRDDAYYGGRDDAYYDGRAVGQHRRRGLVDPYQHQPPYLYRQALSPRLSASSSSSSSSSSSESPSWAYAAADDDERGRHRHRHRHRHREHGWERERQWEREREWDREWDREPSYSAFGGGGPLYRSRSLGR
ncbi:hypothetical protein GGS23DRAFT_596986 [Durotheca rogersii]|uniref:uncharacterized protein n=1 Tax=Durotheca rogersii TaxID=419775 RepID=UPI00221F6B63|nr:uncharacterized protein GGS23DRAFT_596986 [Durotheca rogersii]KAI5863221.1 hypothetical protein GGS23DRAFT_596986 [Durotheca rogersii]